MRFAIALAALLALPAAAQDDPFAKYSTPEATAAALQLALRGLGDADCGTGPASCEPATEAELADPPLATFFAQAGMETGLTSALMQWCDLDWEARSFLPLMNYHREAMRLDERQLTLLALVHGIQQERIIRGLGEQTCPDDLRRNIHAHAPGPERDPEVQ